MVKLFPFSTWPWARKTYRNCNLASSHLTRKSIKKAFSFCSIYFVPFLFNRIQFLRYMKEFFQLTYKVIGEEEVLGESASVDDGERRKGEAAVSMNRLLVTLSCVGVGYSNLNRGIM